MLLEGIVQCDQAGEVLGICDQCRPYSLRRVARFAVDLLFILADTIVLV